MKRYLHWIPRILAIALALFLALFALDVFGEFDTIGETLIALFMHLVPTFVVLAAAAVAWRWNLAGGVLFILLGAMSMVFFDTYEELLSFLLISTPAFVIGALFLWDRWLDTRVLRAS